MLREELAEISGCSKSLPLVEVGNLGYYVLISHEEIDSLIGRLMQMCELTGDMEQRKALKDEIKLRVRNWLDNRYEDAGYKKWSNPNEPALRDGYHAVNIGEQDEVNELFIEALQSLYKVAGIEIPKQFSPATEVAKLVEAIKK